jgi:hypothetical protein
MARKLWASVVVNGERDSLMVGSCGYLLPSEGRQAIGIGGKRWVAVDLHLRGRVVLNEEEEEGGGGDDLMARVSD